MLLKMTAAVVFDMDGLLFDTEKLYGEAVALALAELGYDMAPLMYRSMIGNTWSQNASILKDHYGIEFPTEKLNAAWSRQFELLSEHLVLKPGALELLDTLEELGIPRAIATSSRPEVAYRHLAAHNLADRFQQVVARGDYENSKPSPDPFIKAAERLGFSPKSCLALEDSPNGVQSAFRAGMSTIMVPDIIEPTPEIRALCAYVVPTLHHVRRLILSGRTSCARKPPD